MPERTLLPIAGMYSMERVFATDLSRREPILNSDTGRGELSRPHITIGERDFTIGKEIVPQETTDEYKKYIDSSFLGKETGFTFKTVRDVCGEKHEAQVGRIALLLPHKPMSLLFGRPRGMFRGQIDCTMHEYTGTNTTVTRQDGTDNILVSITTTNDPANKGGEVNISLSQALSTINANEFLYISASQGEMNGHAMAVYNDGEQLHFFDPERGIFHGSQEEISGQMQTSFDRWPNCHGSSWRASYSIVLSSTIISDDFDCIFAWTGSIKLAKIYCLPFANQ